MPKYGNLVPDSQKIGKMENMKKYEKKYEIWKKSHVVKSGSSKHFQRALNDYHMLIFHQDMPKNVILGKNAQIL